MVNRLTLGAGGIGHRTQILIAGIPDTDIRQCSRQTNRFTKVVHFVDQFARAIGQKHTRENSDRDFFAVVVVVRALQLRQPVMDGGCRRLTAAFETQSAEERVGFHDMRQCGCDHILFT